MGGKTKSLLSTWFQWYLFPQLAGTKGFLLLCLSVAYLMSTITCSLPPASTLSPARVLRTSPWQLFFRRKHKAVASLVFILCFVLFCGKRSPCVKESIWVKHRYSCLLLAAQASEPWGGCACALLSPCASSQPDKQLSAARWPLLAASWEMTPVSVWFHRHAEKKDPEDVRFTGKQNRTHFSPSLSQEGTRALLRLLPFLFCWGISAVPLLTEMLTEQLQCSFSPKRWTCHPTGPGKVILADCEAVTCFSGTGFVLKVVVCSLTSFLSFPLLYPFPTHLSSQNL